jgi:hypothetical protein
VTALSVGDFNHDGKPDLVAVGSPAGVGYTGTVWLNDGSGGFNGSPPQNFQPPVSFAWPGTNPQTAVIAVGDFNGDGYADLAVVGSTRGVSPFGGATVDVYLWNPSTTKK